MVLAQRHRARHGHFLVSPVSDVFARHLTFLARSLYDAGWQPP